MVINLATPRFTAVLINLPLPTGDCTTKLAFLKKKFLERLIYVQVLVNQSLATVVYYFMKKKPSSSVYSSLDQTYLPIVLLVFLCTSVIIHLEFLGNVHLMTEKEVIKME